MDVCGPATGPAFRRREVVVAPGDWQVYVEDEWRDALVVVRCGEIELFFSCGGELSFGAGAVLWFEGLGLRAMHNPGVIETLLVAFSRRSHDGLR